MIDPYFFGIPGMTELLYDICRWLFEEEDVEVVGGATTNHYCLDQQAFMEAISVATTTIVQTSVVATTIAQASATVGQGRPSNL